MVAENRMGVRALSKLLARKGEFQPPWLICTTKMEKIVQDTVNIFAGIPLRASAKEPNDQPEALAVIVVDYDGQNTAKLVAGGLAPQAGSAVHYSSFLKRMCELYTQRFGAK